MTTPSPQPPAEPAAAQAPAPTTSAPEPAAAQPPAEPPAAPLPAEPAAAPPAPSTPAPAPAPELAPAPTGELRVRPEIRERALMLWIVTGLAGLCGWIVFSFAWKLEGQDQDRWFRTQLLQAAVVGAVGWLLYPLFGLGFLAHLALGLLGFAAITRNNDFALPLVGGWIRRR